MNANLFLKLSKIAIDKQKQIKLTFESSTESRVLTKIEENPLVPCPFRLCKTKNGIARSVLHKAFAINTSLGLTHMAFLVEECKFK